MPVIWVLNWKKYILCKLCDIHFTGIEIYMQPKGATTDIWAGYPVWITTWYKQRTFPLAVISRSSWASSLVTFHDDVIKWNNFPRYWPFVRGIHRSPVNSPHKGQWRGALMFTLIYARINGWVNNHEAGDSRRYLAHCDVIVMRHVCCILHRFTPTIYVLVQIVVAIW